MPSEKEASLRFGRYYSQMATSQKDMYGGLFRDFDNLTISFGYLLEYKDIESCLMLSSASGEIFSAYHLEKEYSQQNKKLLDLAREIKDKDILMRALFSYGNSLVGLSSKNLVSKENIYAALQIYEEGLSIVGAGMNRAWYDGARARIGLLEQLATYADENTEQRLLEALDAWEIISEPMWKTLIVPGLTVLYEPSINTTDEKPRMQVEGNNIVFNQEDVQDRIKESQKINDFFEQSGIYNQKHLNWDHYITALTDKGRLLHKLGRIMAKSKGSLEWYKDAEIIYRKAIEKDQKTYTSANCIGNYGYLLVDMAEYPSENGQDQLQEALRCFSLAVDYLQGNPAKFCFWQLGHRLPTLLKLLSYVKDPLQELKKAHSYAVEALRVATSAKLHDEKGRAVHSITKIQNACQIFNIEYEFAEWNGNLDRPEKQIFSNQVLGLAVIPEYVFFIWNRLVRCNQGDEILSNLIDFREIIRVTPFTWFEIVFQTLYGGVRTKEALANLNQFKVLIIYTQQYDPNLLFSEHAFNLIKNVLDICTTGDPSQKYAIASQNKSLVEDQMLDFVMDYLKAANPELSGVLLMHQILIRVCKQDGFEEGFQKYIRSHRYDRDVTNLYKAKDPWAKLAILKTRQNNILFDDSIDIIIEVLSALYPNDIELITSTGRLIKLAKEVGIDQAIQSFYPDSQETPNITQLIDTWVFLGDIDAQVWLLENLSGMFLSNEAAKAIDGYQEQIRSNPNLLHMVLIHKDFLNNFRDDGLEIAKENRKQQILIIDALNSSSRESLYRFVFENGSFFRNPDINRSITNVADRMAVAFKENPVEISFLRLQIELLHSAIRFLLE